MHEASFFTAAAAAVALSVTATSAVGAIADADHSQIKFIARQSEVAVDGRFDRFKADIALDPAHPQGGKVRVAIDLASLQASGSDANDLLKSKEFLDVERFPSATFEATSIQAVPGGRLQASGPFTLKGHSANVVIIFTTRHDASGMWFEGGTTISRLAFKVGEGQWADTSTLDDDVQIRFKLHVAR